MQMTPDQIMNVVNSNQQPAQNVEQLNPIIPSAGDEIPFNSAVDAIQQGMNAMQQPIPDDYDTPQPRLKGFSQHQIDRLNKFKTDVDILNDEMFGNFVNTWDKNLTSKNDIVPSNANAFLDWAENLGKMAC